METQSHSQPLQTGTLLAPLSAARTLHRKATAAGRQLADRNQEVTLMDPQKTPGA
jgi:hypothetical protein